MVQWEFEQQCLPILFINNIRPQPRWLRGFLSWGHSHQLTLACNHSNSVRPSVSEECRRQSRILKDSYSGSYSGKRMRQRAKGVGSILSSRCQPPCCRQPIFLVPPQWGRHHDCSGPPGHGPVLSIVGHSCLCCGWPAGHATQIVLHQSFSSENIFGNRWNIMTWDIFSKFLYGLDINLKRIKNWIIKHKSMIHF